MNEGSNVRFSEQEALDFHSSGRPGKIEVIASKPMATQRDLSLGLFARRRRSRCARSPTIPPPPMIIPPRAISSRSSPTAPRSSGLGNLGALASKPVMEGKAVLFKRFADVDSIDIELDTEDPEAFINAVALMEPTFGGINLEDIKAPECFIIEQTLRDRMNIPLMHDDQHGHRDHQRGRASSTPASSPGGDEGRQGGGERRRRGGHRLHRAHQGDGRAARAMC
jgi:malate dehydrogenase (oxaloacetate-decarboxylating)(NADP+)